MQSLREWMALECQVLWNHKRNLPLKRFKIQLW